MCVIHEWWLWLWVVFGWLSLMIYSVAVLVYRELTHLRSAVVLGAGWIVIQGAKFRKGKQVTKKSYK